jgi:hypothetical protein
MNKTILLVSTLVAVALSTPAMAVDFHALAGLQGASPAPLQDGVLATTEGGAECDFAFATNGGGSGGGVCLLSALPNAAFFSVANELPVVGANFLQVNGLFGPVLPTLPTPTLP